MTGNALRIIDLPVIFCVHLFIFKPSRLSRLEYFDVFSNDVDANKLYRISPFSIQSFSSPFMTNKNCRLPLGAVNTL